VANAGAAAPASEINGIIALTLNRPIVRLVQTVAQSVPDNSAVALTFTTEDLDTNNFHDNAVNNTRITPNVAGYYRFYGTYFTAAPGTLTFQAAYFRKNGSGSIAPGPRGNNGSLAQSVSPTALIYCNGAGDYVELMAVQDSTGAVLTNVSSHFSSVFECEFIRS
jgi:hypothetical protein